MILKKKKKKNRYESLSYCHLWQMSSAKYFKQPGRWMFHQSYFIYLLINMNKYNIKWKHKGYWQNIHEDVIKIYFFYKISMYNKQKAILLLLIPSKCLAMRKQHKVTSEFLTHFYLLSISLDRFFFFFLSQLLTWFLIIRVLLTDVLRAMVKKPYKKSFDIIFTRNIKNYQNN